MGIFDKVKKTFNDMSHSPEQKGVDDKTCTECAKPMRFIGEDSVWRCEDCGLETKAETPPPPPRDGDGSSGDGPTGTESASQGEEEIVDDTSVESTVTAPLEFEIVGTSAPLLHIKLIKDQGIYCSTGNVNMLAETISAESLIQDTGDKVKSGVKNWLASEDLSHTVFRGLEDNSEIVLASVGPGAIRAIEITPETSMIVEKGGFLTAQDSVHRTVITNKDKQKLLGGSSFVQQRLSGKGTMFIAAWGDVNTYTLKEGESKLIQYGLCVAYSASMKYEIKRIGLSFFSRISGPGTVYVQPYSKGKLAKSLKSELTMLGKVRSIIS